MTTLREEWSYFRSHPQVAYQCHQSLQGVFIPAAVDDITRPFLAKYGDYQVVEALVDPRATPGRAVTWVGIPGDWPMPNETVKLLVPPDGKAEVATEPEPETRSEMFRLVMEIKGENALAQLRIAELEAALRQIHDEAGWQSRLREQRSYRIYSIAHKALRPKECYDES